MGTTPSLIMPSDADLANAQQMLRATLEQKNNGRAMKALALKRRAKIQAFAATKEIKPATIINFNPVDLVTASGLPYKVPTAEKQVEDMRIRVKYGKSTFLGAYMTIREPHYYPWITDVKLASSGSDLSDGAAEYDCGACRPIESAWHLWASVNRLSADASDMGGVLIFEGDIHAFRKALQAAAVNPDDDRAYLMIPQFVTLEDQNRQYYVDAVRVTDLFAQCFQPQINFFENTMQIAQGMFDDPDERKNITMFHRKWAQYGMNMGWRQSAPAFLNAQEDPMDTCGGCGAQRTRSDARFCHKCNRPYDAYAAFMAGEVVAEAFLATLPEEQLKDVRNEMRRRRRALDLDIHDDEPNPTPPAPASPPLPEQRTESSAPQNPAERGAPPKTLETMERAELLEIARGLGLELHHNTGSEKLIAAIREEQRKSLLGSESENDDDDLGRMP